MPFEWDDKTFISNLEKHGISFHDAVTVFDDPARIISEVTKPAFEERRYKAIGNVDGRVIAVIFTTREDSLSIISARRSRRNKQRGYNNQGPIAR